MKDGQPCPECNATGQYFDPSHSANRHCENCKGTGRIPHVHLCWCLKGTGWIPQSLRTALCTGRAGWEPLSARHALTWVKEVQQGDYTHHRERVTCPECWVVLDEREAAGIKHHVHDAHLGPKKFTYVSLFEAVTERDKEFVDDRWMYICPTPLKLPASPATIAAFQQTVFPGLTDIKAAYKSYVNRRLTRPADWRDGTTSRTFGTLRFYEDFIVVLADDHCLFTSTQLSRYD